jgi:outer membrane biosynthesis protein TonB
MKRFHLCHLHLAATLIILVSCGRENAPPHPAVPERPTIEIDYVTSAELVVHKSPAEVSPVLTKYNNGESVSVLAKRNQWIEVRTGDGSGWAHAADVSSTAVPVTDSTTPRFRRAPAPVSSPSAHGEIILEAQVNTDGDVISVKTLSNSTGSAALENDNRNQLLAAKFYPIIQQGERKPFMYEHRVHY